jgi:hypothetical protein
MKDAYQEEYMDPAFPHVTEAWDLFQDRVRVWKMEGFKILYALHEAYRINSMHIPQLDKILNWQR